MDYSAVKDQGVKDILDAIETSIMNRMLGDPVVAAGTTNTKFKTTYAFSYMIDGKAYYKAATDDIAAPGSGANTSSGEYRKSLLCIDSSGTVTVVHGDVAASASAAELPAATADTIPFGYLAIPPSFTSGSTALTGLINRITHTIDVTYT